MQWWLHLSSDFGPNSCTFFNHFNHILYNIAIWFSSSYNAFIYRLTYTEVTGFKEACTNQKAIAMYFSTTEKFLFHFLTVQSSAKRWRSSEKPFPPWIPQLIIYYEICSRRGVGEGGLRRVRVRAGGAGRAPVPQPALLRAPLPGNTN